MLENSLVPLQFLELRLVDLPLRESFRSAIGERHTRQALLVRWMDPEGAWGIAECSCRPDPYYSAEYLESAWLTIEKQIVPLLSPQMTAGSLLARLKRIRGWEFTRAVVTDAAFDYLRRQGSEGPLESWRSDALDQVSAGISLGLYEDSKALLERIEGAVIEGYRRIKLKIQPGHSLAQLREVRKRFPNLPLALDANGTFDASSLPELAGFQDIHPLALEQPFAPDRLDLAKELKGLAPGLRICLDESIHAFGDLTTSLLLNAIDELNLKPGRVGGEVPALELNREAARNNVPVWIGGMFETGIGRTANLRHAARCPGQSVHDLSPSSRYFQEDLLQDPICMDAQGQVAVPTRPPEIREDLLLELSSTIKRIRVEP